SKLLENESDSNISDTQPVNDTYQKNLNTKNNKLDKSKSFNSDSHYLSQQPLTSSSSKYFLNNYEDDDLSNSESESSISNNNSKILPNSTDNTLNKILDTLLANQTSLKTLLHLYEEIESTIRLQSEEIKKIKDILNESHKTDKASSRAQWAKDKICKHCVTIVKKIKDKLFEVFHDKLSKIDSSASADTIKTFKESQNTKWCLRKLNTPISTISSQTYMDSIISKVWVKEQPTEDDKVFTIAICLYILDPKYEGMKLDPVKVNSLYRSFKA
ncbi:2166_t:CDS:2, partial [Dentiscutata heterogama]